VFSYDIFPKGQNDMISLALFAVTDFASIHLATWRQQALKLALGHQARASFLWRSSVERSAARLL
jgi:hypothetical protein